MAPTPKREKVCYPHNSPSCEQCFSGSVEEPTFVKPKPIEPREEWEIKFEEVVARNYRGQDPYWPDWEGVKSFIRTHKALWEKQAVETERERFLNQKANAHDQEVIRQERARLRKEIKRRIKEESPFAPFTKDILSLLDGDMNYTSGGKTTSIILREVREILETPEMEDIINHAKRIMDERNHTPIKFLTKLQRLIGDFKKSPDNRLDSIVMLIENERIKASKTL